MKCFLGILIIFIINQVSARSVDPEESPIKTVAVIGAGSSGLASAKYSIAQGYDVTVYEQNEQLGGIWWYTDEVGINQYGVEIHSPMYQKLRTNLPHQVMEYNDFKYPNGTKGYPPQPEVLKYLNSYADHFDVRKHIKFNHLAIRVLPIKNDKWEIIVRDLVNNKFETKIFDAVFVASGHFFAPRYPEIEKIDEFQGKKLHSHDYRKAEDFTGERILLIGAGPSGMDLASHLSHTAERITFSQHKVPNETKEARANRERLMPPKTTLQDNVKRFTATGAEFLDGTHETFSVVIFATGYDFKFPFLSVDTGIHVDTNYVEPLYKQIINIEHPTMIFIGVPFTTSTTRMMDLQVRFAMKFLSGEKKLPTKTEMLNDMNEQMQKHWNKGYRKHYSHYLGPEQSEYYKQLSETAGVENIAPVFAAMHFNSRATMKEAPSQFRKYKYNIIDDKTFTKEKEEE